MDGTGHVAGLVVVVVAPPVSSARSLPRRQTPVQAGSHLEPRQPPESLGLGRSPGPREVRRPPSAEQRALHGQPAGANSRWPRGGNLSAAVRQVDGEEAPEPDEKQPGHGQRAAAITCRRASDQEKSPPFS